MFRWRNSQLSSNHIKVIILPFSGFISSYIVLELLYLKVAIDIVSNLVILGDISV